MHIALPKLFTERTRMSKKSKLLSLVLRHKPEVIGLTIHTGGWARIDELLRALKRWGKPISREDLHSIVEQNDKQRFTISEDGLSIRAAQGHSIVVNLGLQPKDPPEVLYHGTSRAALDSIFSQGLTPKARKQVHLSTNTRTALAVGRRHGKPVVLKIDTISMNDAGHVFTQADNGVWLTDGVPARFISFAKIPDQE